MKPRVSDIEYDRYLRMKQSEGQRVDCDHDCGALQEPKTLEEYKNAYLHWRNHGLHYGCSHGN